MNRNESHETTVVAIFQFECPVQKNRAKITIFDENRTFWKYSKSNVYSSFVPGPGGHGGPSGHDGGHDSDGSGEYDRLGGF